MTAVLQHPSPMPTRTGASASIIDHELVITGRFVEDDASVVAVLSPADDVETGVHRLLRVGADAVLAAGGKLNEVTVEQSFGRLAEQLGTTVDHAVKAVSDITDNLVDHENGAVARLLAETRDDLVKRVGALFDPGSRKSAISLLEEVFNGAAARHNKELRGSLDPDDGTSPLGRWRVQLNRELHEATEQIRKDIADLTTKLEVARGLAAERARGTSKGLEFEALVAEVVTDIAAQHGDVAEPVGRLNGVNSSRVGDHVVTLSPEDTGGLVARVVVEAKNRRLSLTKILAELDEAMANREAQAAIAVFARQDLAPITVPMAWFGQRGIVVLDEDDIDRRAFELAVLNARWLARRELTVALEAIDVTAVDGLVADAMVALEKATLIRRCHSTARKSLEQATLELNGLVGEVDEALRRLRQQLR